MPPLGMDVEGGGTAPAEDSLRRRYLFKFSASVLSMFTGMGSYIFISRGLGPSSLGTYNFLLNFFDQVIGVCDAGASNCFYSKLSQNKNRTQWLAINIYYMLIVLGAVVLVLGTIMLLGKSPLVFPGQDYGYIIAAMALSGLMYIMQSLGRMLDAFSITVQGEKMKMRQGILSAAVIASAFFLGWLHLEGLFVINSFTVILLIAMSLWLLSQHGIYPLKNLYPIMTDVMPLLKEAFHYVKPLIAYTIIGIIVSILDKWLLQYYSGSTQQGYYWFSYKIQQFCALLASVFTPLLMREFVKAKDAEDHNRTVSLFSRYVPLFTVLTGYFSLFIAIEASNVSHIFGGQAYDSASTTLFVISLQTLLFPVSQFSASWYFGTGSTRIYSNIGMFYMLLGVPVTYVLIAPHEMFGLSLGATGLALKVVFMDYLWSNTLLYFVCRDLRLSFMRFLFNQIAIAVVFLGSAKVIHAAIGHYVDNSLLAFMFDGMVYTVIVLLIVIKVPTLFGIDSNDVEMYLKKPLIMLARRTGLMPTVSSN